MISISIVSHGQAKLIARVMADLAAIAGSLNFELILTKNIPEQWTFLMEELPYPVKIIENATPRGFGANHNAAFQLAGGKWFCVLNPDIRMPTNPFPLLLEALTGPSACVVAPAILAPTGQIEDSVRRFPTPLSLFMKTWGKGDGRYLFSVNDAPFSVDWVGGMFMLFGAENYRRVGGFDEGFFLYYEDVDICVRLQKFGGRVIACPQAQVIHDARRSSRSDFRYLRWHIASLVRYLVKHWLRLPKTDKL